MAEEWQARLGDVDDNPSPKAAGLDGTCVELRGIWDIIQSGINEGLVIVPESAYGHSYGDSQIEGGEDDR